MKGRKPNYDKNPHVNIPGDYPIWSGWQAITKQIDESLDRKADKNILVVDAYQGVYHEEIINGLSCLPNTAIFLDTRTLFKDEAQIQALTASDATEDEIFGYMSRLNMIDFLDSEKIEQAKKVLAETEGLSIVYGPGATLIYPKPNLLVFADMPRWEIQQRFRNNKIPNLGLNNENERFSLQYKRGYFIDWRVCDRHKKSIFEQVDCFLDTTLAEFPKLIGAEAMSKALLECTTRPFRVVPFFDPGVWGGQWMRKVCDLGSEEPNYAWGFDCVPEENSLLFKFGKTLFETPSINLVFRHPERLLGGPVYARFGAEFPIRFDFLDTMGGGNLSLQVHPRTEFIQQHFGMYYTQDESYYILDAEKDAVVYLGTKDGTDAQELIQSLKDAQVTGNFEADAFIAKCPVQKHDHILIPAGTIHCSGKGSMVLEISATPYIFTFKLWDWGRLGLDGRPRPINIERGAPNIAWERNATWCKNNLIGQVEPLSNTDGHREERTGLHALEFIETRRHWFTEKITLSTEQGVNVLNLVTGDEVTVESPDGSFDPYIVHYAETFIVPAHVGAYSLRPSHNGKGEECAVIQAYVRH